MSEPFAVSHDSECLLRIIETAAQVQRRSQFFVWSQGDVQRWLPHKVLLCGAFDLQSRHMVFDVFNSVTVTEPLQRLWRDLHGPFLEWVQQSWLRNRRQPARLKVQLLGHEASERQLLAEGFTEFLVHGLSRPGRPDDIESLFVLGSPGRDADDTVSQALGWLMPYIHITYQRVFENEREMGAGASDRTKAGTPAGARGQPITRREAELLHWVREGMSNQQIAEQLGISALTVKNHVQKILRKLGAANRTQAVAMAMTRKLLPGQGIYPAPSLTPSTPRT
jgi:transcriptional regulator EpsA